MSVITGGSQGFPGDTVVKNAPAKAEAARDSDLIPGSGRSQEKEMVTCSSCLAWRILETEEPTELQFKGSQRIRHD